MLPVLPVQIIKASSPKQENVGKSHQGLNFHAHSSRPFWMEA